MGKIHEALQRAERERAKLGELRPRTGPDPIVETSDDSGSRTPSERRHDGRLARAVVGGGERMVAEYYGTLRARIQSLRRARPIRSIVVTSALPREGKTTTALNLALSFGLNLDADTVLVDADFRSPNVQNALPSPPKSGLAEVLAGETKVDDVLVQFPDTRLWVLPIHRIPKQPAELIASRAMHAVIDDLHERYETVIVDAPPVLGLPEATTLVDLCDAALLVVRAGWSSRDQLESVLERIDAPKVLGTVFNQSSEHVGTYSYYGYSEARV